MPGIASGTALSGDYRLLIAALAALGLIQLGFYWHPLSFAIGAVCGLIWALRNKAWRWPVCLMSLALIHAAWVHWQQERLRWPSPGSSVGDYRVLALSPEPDRTRLLLRDAQGRRLRVAAYAEAAAGLERVSIHSCIQAHLRLKPPHGTVNWFGFDYGRWLYSQAIHGLGSVQQWQPCLEAVLTSAPIRPSSGPGMALLRALVFADRSGFSAEIWDTLARTGVSHLFAISGLHLGLLGAWGWAIGRLLWALRPSWQHGLRRRQCAAISSALWMSGYMVLAHGQVSAWRAWAMGILVLGVLSAGRSAAPLAGWSLALIGVLTIAPLHSLNASLWLSFAAVLLIITAWPWLKPYSWLRRLIALQALLGVGLAPLCWAWFGQWSLVGLGLNVVLVPAMVLLLPLCLGAVLLDGIGLWSQPQLWLTQALDGLYAALAWWAAKPWVVWPAQSLNLLEAALLLLALALALVVGLQRRDWLIGACVLWCCALWAGLRPVPAPAMDRADIWVLDVGQGSAAIVRTAEHVVVIDSGPRSRSGRFDAGAMIVRPQLEALGLSQVDLLITTHEDRDHAGGRRALTQAFSVKEQWGAAGSNCREALQWSADGVRISSLALDRPAHWYKNDLSCVVLVQVGQRRMLFPGDVELRAENAMLRHPQLQAGVDVVMVPHHGSQTSSTAEWVAMLHPDLAIVPAGVYNRWGFPRPAVVQRWRDIGSEVRSTSAGGALRLNLPDMTIQRPGARPWRLEAL